MHSASDDLASLIARLGADALELDRLAREDDFLAVGGDSIGALLWLNRIAEATGVELPVRTVFEARTAERLAVAVRAAGPPKARAEPPAQGDAPLSPTQQAMWSHQVFVPDSRTNNSLCALQLEGDLDVAVLTRSIEEILRRHEVLRTVFPYRAGGPVTVVQPPGEIQLSVDEVPDLERAARAFAAGTFDLEKGPLQRWQLVRSGPREHVLLLAVHHIVFDRWSAVVLVDDLSAIYTAFRDGRPSPLPALAVQFGEHVRRQQARADDEEIRQQIEHWRAVLADDVAPLTLPPDADAEVAPAWQGHRRTLHLSTEELERLRDLARSEHATLYMALTATFAALLSRETGGETIAIAGIVAGRRWLHTEGMIGPFLNPIALRIPIRGAATWRELLRRTREVVLDGLSNQDVAWETLARVLHPKPAPGGNPFFRIVIQMLNLPAPAAGPGALRIRRLPVHGGVARFDHFPEIEEAEDGLRIHLEGRRNLYSTAGLERRVQTWRRALAAIAANPDVPLANLG